MGGQQPHCLLHACPPTRSPKNVAPTQPKQSRAPAPPNSPPTLSTPRQEWLAGPAGTTVNISTFRNNRLTANQLSPSSYCWGDDEGNAALVLMDFADKPVALEGPGGTEG